jgi:death on curing protein
MEPITVEKIIEIHNDIIEEFGGANGVLDIGSLDFLVYRANNEDNIFRKSALILFCIASQHPFIDGNKRTALVTAENILGQSGYFIEENEENVVQFMVKVASYTQNVNNIENWLKENISKKL